MIRVFYRPCGKSYKEQHTAAYELLYAATDICGLPFGRVEKTESGKPYFADTEGTFFSIAHGSGYAVVAIGDKPCGVDIEGGKPISERVRRRYLGGAEGEDAIRRWTEKESYGKLNGKGFFAEEPAEKIAFKSYCLDALTVTVCFHEGSEISDKLEMI